eukprot:gene8819-1614_t
MQLLYLPDNVSYMRKSFELNEAFFRESRHKGCFGHATALVGGRFAPLKLTKTMKKAGWEPITEPLTELLRLEQRYLKGERNIRRRCRLKTLFSECQIDTLPKLISEPKWDVLYDAAEWHTRIGRKKGPLDDETGEPVRDRWVVDILRKFFTRELNKKDDAKKDVPQAVCDMFDDKPTVQKLMFACTFLPKAAKPVYALNRKLQERPVPLLRDIDPAAAAPPLKRPQWPYLDEQLSILREHLVAAKCLGTEPRSCTEQLKQEMRAGAVQLCDMAIAKLDHYHIDDLKKFA